MAAIDTVEVADCAAHARELLAKARKHLASDDLHPASRKGWRAAEHMAKAVAAARGWEYRTHDHFSVVLNSAWGLTGEDRLLVLCGIANDLHANHYRRKRHLDADMIGKNLESMAELVELLEPLTT